MFQRIICRCPLCQLEKRIISRLEEDDSLRWFGNLGVQIPSIRAFDGMPELISYAHRAGQDVDKRRICDGIYTALLRQLSSSENAELLQGLLVRMLIPGLHR